MNKLKSEEKINKREEYADLVEDALVVFIRLLSSTNTQMGEN